MARVLRFILKLAGGALAIEALVVIGLIAYVVVNGNQAVAEGEIGTSNEAAPGQLLDVDGRQIHVRTFGERGNPAVLLLHGFTPAGGFSWSKFPELLAVNFHVMVPDMVGSGHSERVAEPGPHYTHIGQASRMAALVERLGIGDPVAVVGTSFGGGVAAEMALDYPEQVGRLVLIDAQAYELGGGIFQFLGSLPLGIGRTLTWYGQGGGSVERDREAAKSGCESGNDCPDEEELEKQVSLKLIRGTTDAFHAMSKTAVDARLSGNLGQIRGPTLVIWGADDNLIPASQGEQLAVDLPQARLVTVEGAGHNPYRDQPDVVAKLVTDFLLDGQH